MKTTQLTITTICILALAGGALGGELYVPDEYETIQAAIDAAYDGDTVVVAPGIYGGRVGFDGKAITVRGVDANDPNVVASTIIEQRRCYGAIGVNGPVVFTDNEDGNSVLAGFTLAETMCGGHIYCKYSSPRIINCVVEQGISCYTSNPTIINCTVKWGIYCEGSSPEIRNCTITKSGIYCIGSDPTITNCSIKGSSREHGGGGGIHCRGSSPTITDCTISDNRAEWGGGILCFDGSNATIVNCAIIGNKAEGYGDGGGIFCWDSSVTISNCVISGNSADNDGGAISALFHWNYPDEMVLTITNCIISNNSAGEGGGGISAWSRFGHREELLLIAITNCTLSGNSASNGNALAFDSDYQHYPSHLQMTNSILWDGGDEIWNNDDSNVVITYSDVQGGWEGVGNIDADPFFVEAGYWDVNGVWVEGDYRLLEGSPCIDAGDPNYQSEPNETDMDGEPRVMGDRVDIGADEVALYIDFGLDEFWMYQNLPGQSNSDLTAGVSVTDDPMGNSSYSYEWEILLAGDVSLAPTTVSGGGAGDAYWTFAAPGCDEPAGLSDSGQVFTVRVTVTGDDYGNRGVAEAEFGIALLGDINNDGAVNVADRSIANVFWRTGSAGPYTLRHCDVNCDGVVNKADRLIANAIWRGILGQNSVSAPCPLR